ncbi:MAG: hypothetical protein H7833_09925 [Magnetococcus sp. DMHC-1]|nr:hypothetical protein [Magnetococcales bacterium]
MKLEEWIGVTGAIFLLGVMALAFYPSDPQKPQTPAGGGGEAINLVVPQPGFVGAPPAGGTSPAYPGLGQMLNVAAPGNAVPGGTTDPNAATTTATEGGTPIQPGMVPFEQAPMVRFEGTIQQITELPQQDRQVHIWIHEIGGRESHVSVGPKWFLGYLGCDLIHDQRVSGKGFRFDRTRLDPDPVVYAKQLFVNGRWCQLRNDEGFALWSNQLR